MKMDQVDRANLLQKLQTVQPGLSKREIVEQSSCVIFRKGWVMTYNDEVSIKCPSDLDKEFQAAVQADAMTSILNKMGEENISLTVGDEHTELIIGGKRRRSGIRMEKDILLPINNVEKPLAWEALPADFAEGINAVQACAGKDESQFILTCIHVHPKWVECSDDDQIARYRVKLPITESCLVRRDSIKHIIQLGMTEVSVTEGWLHFRNPAGVYFSCRRYVEEYPSLCAFLAVEGTATTLPKGLGEACDMADVFSSENADENRVFVELTNGKITIRGDGSSGWHEAERKIVYDGDRLAFYVSPKLLREITSRHNECILTSEKLKVEYGKFSYVTCLYPANLNKPMGAK